MTNPNFAPTPEDAAPQDLAGVYRAAQTFFSREYELQPADDPLRPLHPEAGLGTLPADRLETSYEALANRTPEVDAALAGLGINEGSLVSLRLVHPHLERAYQGPARQIEGEMSLTVSRPGVPSADEYIIIMEDSNSGLGVHVSSPSAIKDQDVDALLEELNVRLDTDSTLFDFIAGGELDTPPAEESNITSQQAKDLETVFSLAHRRR